jgi:hypothetical protein
MSFWNAVKPKLDPNNLKRGNKHDRCPPQRLSFWLLRELDIVGKGELGDVHAMRTTRWRGVSSARPRKSLPTVGLHEIYLRTKNPVQAPTWSMTAAE